MGTLDELMSEIRHRLAREPGLEWAYLFGSAARGADFRDLDVAIMPAPGAYGSIVDWGGLGSRLEEGLGAPLDVVDLRSAPLAFTGPLLERCVVLLDRDVDRRHDWEATTTSRWLDMRPSVLSYRRLRNEVLRGSGSQS